MKYTENILCTSIKFSEEKHKTLKYRFVGYESAFVGSLLSKESYFCKSNYIYTIFATHYSTLTTNMKEQAKEGGAVIVDHVTVDCAIFGFSEGRLKVLLIHSSAGDSKGLWKLPGNHIRTNENLDEAARRILFEMTGVNHMYLEQFKAFGAVDRYPHSRIVTVAYFALVKPEEYQLAYNHLSDGVKWADMEDLPHLPYDHDLIVAQAYEALSKKIRHEPIGFNLLPEKFTLLQLQELYETLLRVKLDKPNFRRKFMKMDLLVPLEETQTNVSHRAAKLFRFDPAVYQKLQKKWFCV